MHGTDSKIILDDILVSVVVPVYNVEGFLPQCVDSLLAQTHHNIEIILVDDGSSDGSSVICDEYAQRDSRITVIHQENQGQAAARNAGIQVAQGAYVGFVDSDDFVESTMFRSLLEATVSHNVQVAACGRFTTDEEGAVTGEVYTLPHEKSYSVEEAIQQILTSGQLDVAVCDKLFRRELFDGIEFPVGEINEDAAIIFRLLCRTAGIVHIGKPMYHYRQWSNSTSKQRYNHRRAVVLDNADRFEAMLLPRYPSLHTALHQYRAAIALDLLCLMLKDLSCRKEHAADYRRSVRILRKEQMYVYNNANLSLAWKLRACAIVLGLYGPLYALLRKH